MYDWKSQKERLFTNFSLIVPFFASKSGHKCVGVKPEKVRLVCPLAQKWLWRHNRHVLKKCLHRLILVQFRFHLLVWWEILQFGHGFYLHPWYDSFRMTHIACIMLGIDKHRMKAITDLSTGEIMYLIDDNGGSEIYYARKTTSVPSYDVINIIT